jgi:pimeloyl-ACP methyl ester carboxylesterase
MSTAKVRGLNIFYEIIGSSGPVIALMPGARRGSVEMKPLAEKIAAGGFRVLLHDRRNTGASDMLIDESETEENVWADDLHALLKQLNLAPAYVSGASSGARTSLNFALRHPEALRGLLIMRVTGGDYAASKLPQNYYRIFIETAEKGGMKAVAEMDRFRDYNATNPKVKEQLLAMDAKTFIAGQKKLLEKFLAGANLPVMGMTKEELGSIKAPVLVIPGNDLTHSSKSGRIAHELIPGSEMHQLPITDKDLDLVPWTDWSPLEPEIAATFIDFMRRHERAAA